MIFSFDKMRPKVYTQIAATIFAVLVAICSAKPNIVMIMADDLGWNDVGFHGSEISTPIIDALAENGVVLNNYYTAPNCGPSRAQFLTGKYLTHLGLQHKNLQPCRPSGIPLTESTIADELKTLGYKSHLIGKWHGGLHTYHHLPTNRGFDSFRGMLNGLGDHYTHMRGYQGEQYLDFYNDTTPYPGADGIYSTEYFRRRAHEVIDEHSASGDPMFMFLSFQAPHTPNQAPQSYIDRYEHILHPGRRKYAAMVTAMDHAIGSVVVKLMEANMFDNTVIVVSTDNGGQALIGGASNYPLRGNKGNYYEAGIKGVALVSSPLLKRNGELDSLFHITDWMPTFVHLAGGKLNGHDGVNQWDAISMGVNSSRTEIIYNIDPLSMSNKMNRRAARKNSRGRRGRRAINGLLPDDFIGFFESPTTLNSFGTTPTPALRFETVAADTPRNSFGPIHFNTPDTVFPWESSTTPASAQLQPQAPEYNIDFLSIIRSGDWKLMTGEIGFDEIIPNPKTDINGYAFIRSHKKRQSSIRLFNIANDPSESNDLSNERPDIVLKLINRLIRHQETALPPYYPGSSRWCGPQQFGNIYAWGPYME